MTLLRGTEEGCNEVWPDETVDETVPEISAAGLEIVALMNGLAADPMGTFLVVRAELGILGWRALETAGRRMGEWAEEKQSDSIDRRGRGSCVLQWRRSEGGEGVG